MVSLAKIIRGDSMRSDRDFTILFYNSRSKPSENVLKTKRGC